MAQQIQELINKIKQEGVEAAEHKARDIERSAEKKAEEIVHQAKKESERLLREAQESIKKLEASSRMNLIQSARDTLLSLKGEIQNLLKKIVDQKVSESLAVEHLSSLIGKVVADVLTSEKAPKDMILILNEDDLRKLKEGFLVELQHRLKKDIKLQASEDVTKGLLIS